MPHIRPENVEVTQTEPFTYKVCVAGRYVGTVYRSSYPEHGVLKLGWWRYIYKGTGLGNCNTKDDAVSFLLFQAGLMVKVS